MLKKITNFIAFLSLSLLFVSCSTQQKDENQPIIEKKRREINMDKRAEKAAGGLFGNLGGNNNTTYNFATSNVLWRASLETLNFMPLNTIDYSGGLIISDWYSKDYSDESIKITVRFLSNELKASSVDIKSFKKNCINNKCKTNPMGNNFNRKIKDNIIAKARELKIKDETSKK